MFATVAYMTSLKQQTLELAAAVFSESLEAYSEIRDAQASGNDEAQKYVREAAAVYALRMIRMHKTTSQLAALGVLEWPEKHQAASALLRDSLACLALADPPETGDLVEVDMLTQLME